MPLKGGEIFILKMGDSVRIADMAKNLILLSGLEPGKDQCEKLDEELMEDPAGFTSSEHSDILILRGENQPVAELDEHRIEFEPARLVKDGSQLVANCNQLKMPATDGKNYMKDVAAAVSEQPPPPASAHATFRGARSYGRYARLSRTWGNNHNIAGKS